MGRAMFTEPASDITLLERVATGDVRALWELSARHAIGLRALAFGILHDAVAAEQVVQARARRPIAWRDRKSTRLNSSHLVISYAVFCLKKKKTLTAYHVA